MFPPALISGTGAQMRAMLKLARPRGKTVLDLCCGPGRCSIALAKAGYRVTGVDRTRFLLNKARANARKAGVRIEFVRSDMRDFVRPAAYDLALSMFTSFGYFDDKSEDVGVLRNVFTSLRPGGVFVIDVMSKERIARAFRGTMSEELPDGRLRVQRQEIFDDWSRIQNEWLIINGNRVSRFRFHHTLYSGQELKALLLQAGFENVTLYGSLDGDAFGLRAERLIAVARKSATV